MQMKYVLLRRECPMQCLAEDVRSSSYLRVDGKNRIEKQASSLPDYQKPSVDRPIWYESMVAIRQRMRSESSYSSMDFMRSTTHSWSIARMRNPLRCHAVSTRRSHQKDVRDALLGLVLPCDKLLVIKRIFRPAAYNRNV